MENLTDLLVVNSTTSGVVIPSSDLSFTDGLIQSFLIVFLAELGDRTFILLMLLTTKFNRLVLFLFASVAMVFMHVLSVLIGAVIPLFIPEKVIHLLVIGLFVFFGAKLLKGSVLWGWIRGMLYGKKQKKRRDGDSSSSDDSEYEEANISSNCNSSFNFLLCYKEQADRIGALNDLKEPLLPSNASHRTPAPWWKFWEKSQLALFMFILMCSEWGDVSQVVVIGLAAKYGLWGIIFGGAVAHVISIFVAIVIGSMVSKAINEKWMNLVAGGLFMGFAVREIVEFIQQ